MAKMPEENVESIDCKPALPANAPVDEHGDHQVWYRSPVDEDPHDNQYYEGDRYAFGW